MIHKYGDLFTTTADYIGHGVNCRGKMGAGIAKIMREKYPNNYDLYQRKCSMTLLNPGDIGCTLEKGKVIVNMATQLDPGPDARYGWVFEAATRAAFKITKPYSDTFKNLKPVLAIPEIGCGIGGLEWAKVEHLLCSVEILWPGFEFEVWHYV